MKDFFIDWWDMLTERPDGFWMWVGTSLMWILSAALVFLALWGLFYLADTIGTDTQQGEGKIISRNYHPSYTTTTWVTSGKTTIPITTYHPERWSVDIEKDGNVDEVTVSESYCGYSKIGEVVHITYKTGRISGGLYIKSIDQ